MLSLALVIMAAIIPVLIVAIVYFVSRRKYGRREQLEQLEKEKQEIIDMIDEALETEERTG